MPRSSRRIEQPMMFGAVAGQKIDENADLGRDMMPVWIDRIHREFDRVQIWEDAHEAPFPDVVRNDESGAEKNPATVQGRNT